MHIIKLFKAERNIWNLLKSEWHYNRPRLILSFAFCLNGSMYIFTALPVESRESILLLILFSTALFSAMGGQSDRLKEKLDRRDSLLPLSRRDLASSNLLFPLSCWAAVIVINLSTILILTLSGREIEGYLSLHHWFGINGIIILIIGTGQIFSDLRSWNVSAHSRRLLWIGWRVVKIIILVICLFMANVSLLLISESSFSLMFIQFFNTVVGIALINGLGLAALVSGFYLNQKKPSYINP
ncbi:hypothetical protein KAR48_00165 [bacterium]|nr:hypothetical protein [bacterium]